MAKNIDTWQQLSARITANTNVCSKISGSNKHKKIFLKKRWNKNQSKNKYQAIEIYANSKLNTSRNNKYCIYSMISRDKKGRNHHMNMF